MVVLGTVVAALAMTPTGAAAVGAAPATARPGTATARSDAVSFLGLQLTVDRHWQVQYFAGCPVARRTIYIGASPAPYYSCPEIGIGASTNVVVSQFATTRARGTGRWRWVHGLHVHVTSRRAGFADWDVPSAHASLSASGARALAVLRTLRRATPGAQRAPAMVVGSDHRVGGPAPGVAAITGLVRLTGTGGVVRTAQSTNGFFSLELPAGRYRAQASTGNETCPRVELTAVGGGTTRVAVTCRIR